MAKKKFENIKLEQTELQPTTIGAFESRKRTSFSIFVIITLFVVVVIFLPQISDFVNQLFNPVVTPVDPTTPVDPGENPSDGDDNYADTFYTLSSDLKIDREDLSLSELSVNSINNTISYTVTNNMNRSQNMQELNYYLEIYSSERVLLERVKLVKETALASGAFKTLTSNISNNSALNINQLVLVKKSVDDYPIVELSSITDGVGTMVCSRNGEKATYKFSSNLLKEVVHEYGYLTTNENYNEVYTNYKSLSNTYNNKTGITSTFFEYDGGFNVSTIVNLEEASQSYVYSIDTFKLDTEAKVVKFEMEAQNFTCE